MATLRDLVIKCVEQFEYAAFVVDADNNNVGSKNVTYNGEDTNEAKDINEANSNAINAEGLTNKRHIRKFFKGGGLIPTFSDYKNKRTNILLNSVHMYASTSAVCSA